MREVNQYDIEIFISIFLFYSNNSLIGLEDHFLLLSFLLIKNRIDIMNIKSFTT